jgi:hypothetical protein
MFEQERVVTITVRVVEGEDRQHASLLRDFIGTVVGQAVVTDVVGELVRDEAFGVWEYSTV